MVTRRPRGFTLIEVLTVIGIIIILVGIAVYGMGKVMGNSKQAATKSTLENLRSMLSEYEVVSKGLNRQPAIQWYNDVSFKDGSDPISIWKDADPTDPTTNQPEPARAWVPSCGISPPIANDGSRPRRSRTNAIIAVVVVLPWAPATTIESARPTSSARSSARLAPATRPAHADETNASASAGGSGGPSEISTGIPAARTPAR